MNFLFITMVWPTKGESNLYSDLVEEFTNAGHDVYVAALCEKRRKISTHMEHNGKLHVLYIKCGNIQKINKYMKVINSCTAGIKLLIAVLWNLRRIPFASVIFALPPLLISPFVVMIKKHYGTKLYLLLKEFWPQDPVDLGAMRKGGIVWRVFDYLEGLLYKKSDYVGTMSEAGTDYFMRNNHGAQSVVEVCANSLKKTSILTEAVRRSPLLEDVMVVANNTAFMYICVVHSIFCKYIGAGYGYERRVIFFSSVINIIGSGLLTYRALLINPEVSRYLGTGLERFNTIRDSQALLGNTSLSNIVITGIGSYGYFYAIPVLLIVLIYGTKNYKGLKKGLCLVGIIAIFLLSLKASFVTSIVLSLHWAKLWIC